MIRHSIMAANYLTTSRSLLGPPQLPHPRRLRISFSHSHRKKPAADPERRRGRAPVHSPSPSHPGFGTAPHRRAKKIPIPDTGEPAAGVRVTDRGLSYLLDGMPFEFQYSYTEAPRARPVAFREAPFLPFGPQGTPRPWTGRKPLPKSRKELPEFDSFVLPPPGKKGVKPVQSPGPFLAGMEPRYQAASREEVLGEPLTKEEVAQLVNGSLKTKRQLNIGRDGLTHNMLENVHAHWKRKRVCKIKCKGVCTVDMDNVCQQLEEKVGGKVIHRQGGVIFLFRGRNYNYRTRPCFPPMLWKPAAAVYPRLIKKVPDGLTLTEALEMRKRGRQLLPICKLGKNGVYVNLVAQVREAFQACDLVRVDCSGLNRSDCRKIGAKLKDLVPCILLSFEFEHILMWRGNDWKSSLPPLQENNFDVASDQQLFTQKGCLNNKVTESGNAQASIEIVKWNDRLNPVNDMIWSSTSAVPGLCNSVGVPGTEPSSAAPLEFSSLDRESYFVNPSVKSALCFQCIPSDDSENGEPFEWSADKCERSEQSPDELEVCTDIVCCSYEIDELETRTNNENIEGRDVDSDSSVPSYMEGVLLLLTQAVDSGRALFLDGNEVANADMVYQKSVTFARTAPRGPIFQQKTRKSRIRRNQSDKHVRATKLLVENEAGTHVEQNVTTNRGMGIQRNSHPQEFLSDAVPQGSLRVDELAKLLA